MNKQQETQLAWDAKVELNSVDDPRLLNCSKIYQINGVFYQYLHQSGTDNHPQYVFGHLPTPGQKKKSNLVLNRDKLRIRCLEVVGMFCNTSAKKNSSEQLQLF